MNTSCEHTNAAILLKTSSCMEQHSSASMNARREKEKEFMRRTKAASALAAAALCLLWAAAGAVAAAGQEPAEQSRPAAQGEAPQPAPVQQETSHQTSGPADESGLDIQAQSRLLSKIHQINQIEIQAGNLAQTRGGTFQVREYGDRLSRDHTMADSMILNYARKKGIPIMTPTPANPKEQEQAQQEMAAMQELSTLQGPQFDQKFLELMQNGHKAAITLLVSNENQMKPSPLRRLVSRLVPVLGQHYEIASGIEIQRLVKGQLPVTAGNKGGV
jgi:putative membrane protein